MRLAFAPIVLILVAGCASTRSPARGAAALTQVERMELYSLDPDAPPRAGDESFHGYAIRGHATIDDAAERTRLADVLRRSSSEHVNGAVFDVRVATLCLPVPHHGLRVGHAGVTTDYVICFECSDTRDYRDDGQPIPPFHTDGSVAKRVFDDALRRHGLPVASVSAEGDSPAADRSTTRASQK